MTNTNYLFVYKTSAISSEVVSKLQSIKFKKNDKVYIVVDKLPPLIAVLIQITLSKLKIKPEVIILSLEQFFDGYIPDMKFDFILGNPPYQSADSGSDAGKLYINITKKVLSLLKEDSGIIKFLTPSTIVRSGRNKFILSDIEGLKQIDYTVNTQFSVGVYIIEWTIDKSYKGNTVEIINKDGSIDHRDKSEPLVDRRDMVGINLFEKIKSRTDKIFIGDQSVGSSVCNLTKSANYKFRVWVNYFKDKYRFSSRKPKLYNRRKIAISMSKAYSSENYIVSKDDYGQLHLMIDINGYSKVQIQNIKNYLYNDISVAICNKYKILYETGMNNILYNFPQIDIDVEYTREDIIELFNLTEKEVEYLES